ncbi:hypothetical protein BDW22DRAFT_1363085 [Trametopsis cervina]|nr:hypothetical protein BDW22DRAFT_1363085 [Trametopsis cervina]
MPGEKGDPPKPPPPSTVIPTRVRPPAICESSWSILWRYVREEDEEIVQEHRSRVETGIVFAGLFCIMLALFLIDSTHLIRPDHSSMTVALLRQIAIQTQNFSLSSHFVNTTAAMAASAVLPALADPSLNHILASIFWTTSLALNIAGVFLGLYIKNELQDQVLLTNTSTRLHLRRRYLDQQHNSSAWTWTPLNLVHVLDFMLQVSMCSFLAGLTLYSFDTHHTVGYATTLIIGGWALSFLIIVISPVVFPESPYRIPLAGFLLRRVYTLLRRPVAMSAYDPLPTPCSFARLHTSELGDVGTGGRDTIDIDLLVSYYVNHWEEHVLNLVWDALKENEATPEDFLLLVKKIIHEYKFDTPDDYMPEKDSRSFTSIDLRPLPREVYSTMINNIADLLKEEIHKQSLGSDTVLEWTPPMKEALQYILADSSHNVPPATQAVLSTLLTSERADDFYNAAIITLRGKPASAGLTTREATFLFGKVEAALQMLPNNDVLKSMASFLLRCFCNDVITPQSSNNVLLAVVKDHHSRIPPACLHLVGSTILRRLTHEVRATMFWHTDILDMITVILTIDALLPAAATSTEESLHDQLIKVTRLMLRQSKNTSIFIRFATPEAEADALQSKAASQLFIDAITSSTPAVRQEIFVNVDLSFRWQQYDHPAYKDDSWDTFVRLDPAKTYLLVLKALDHLDNQNALPIPGSAADKALRDIIRKIGDPISYGLRNAGIIIDCGDSQAGEEPVAPKKNEADDEAEVDSSSEAEDDTAVAQPEPVEIDPRTGNRKTYSEVRTYSGEDTELARQCLVIMGSLDKKAILPETATDEEFDAWADKFDVDASFFADNIVKALVDLVPVEEAASYVRARRIEFLAKRATPEPTVTSKDVTVAEHPIVVEEEKEE